MELIDDVSGVGVAGYSCGGFSSPRGDGLASASCGKWASKCRCACELSGTGKPLLSTATASRTDGVVEYSAVIRLAFFSSSISREYAKGRGGEPCLNSRFFRPWYVIFTYTTINP